MAKRKRHRRAAARPTTTTRHKRRRKHNPVGLSVRRTHSRKRRHSVTRRRRHNPFGLGKGRGLLQIPNLTQAAIGIAGGIGTAALLARLDKPDATGKTKLPGLVGKDGKPNAVGYAARALAGIVLGSIAGKVLKKPALGAAWALGSVVFYGASFAQASKFLGLSGGVGDYVEDQYGGSTSGGQYTENVSGGQYMAAPTVQGALEDGDFGDAFDMDQVTMTPF